MNFREYTDFLLRHLYRFTQRRDLIYIFLLAVVVRFIFMILMMGQVDSAQMLSLSIDTTEYVKAAEALAAFHFGDQTAFFIFGPGYSLFLAPIFFVFGVHPLPVLIIQIILSGVLCLMLYRLGYELTGSRAVGIIAALFSALSFTSISLANFILSGTLFLLVFLWGNLAFILAMKNRRSWYFVFAGICLGGATLIRSMGQFWPLFLVVFILLFPERRLIGWRWNSRREFWKRAGLAPLIAIVIMSGWIARNYAEYKIPSVAIAGPVGLGRLSAVTEAEATGADYSQVLTDRVERFRERTGIHDLTPADQYHLLMGHFRETLKEHPGALAAKYFDLIRDNATAVNELYRVQLPRYQNPILEFMTTYRAWRLHYAVIVLSGIGLLIMAIRRRWLAFFYLGGWMFYVLALNGFSLWQGSRTFFPAEMAWTVLAATVFVGIGRGLSRLKFIDAIRQSSDRPYRSDLLRRVGDTLSNRTVLRFTIVGLLIIVSWFYIWHAVQYGDYIIDDAGISYAYARHMVEGDGLVLNAGGEKVEGYTNALWVGALAVTQLAGLFDPIITPKVLSILLTVLTFVMVFRWFYRIRPRMSAVLIAFIATAAVACNASLTVWSVSGLENGLYNFLIILALYRMYFESTGQARYPISGAILFLVAITRPDGIVYTAAFLPGFVFMFIHRSWRIFFINLAEFCLLFAAYHVWHYGYFREILTNTYYAKRILSDLKDRFFNGEWYGWTYIGNGLTAYRLYGLLPVALIALVGRYWKLGLLLVVSAAVSLLLPLISRGDWMMQYRFLHPFFMLLLLAVAAGLMNLVEFITARKSILAGILAVLVLLAMANTMWGSVRAITPTRQNLTVPFKAVRSMYYVPHMALADTLTLSRPSVLIADAGGTTYYEGLDVIDIGLLCDYHLARYRFTDYFRPYIFDERRPDIISKQGLSVARQTRIGQYRQFRDDYITYEERSFAQETGDSDIVDGIYIRKDHLISSHFPIYARAADYGAVAGYSVPQMIDFDRERLAVALLWISPFPEDASKSLRLFMRDGDGRLLIDTLITAGYGWYRPEQWSDSGYVRQVILLPVTPQNGDKTVTVGLYSDGADTLIIGAAIAGRNYSRGLFASDMQWPLNFVGRNARWLHESIQYLQMTTSSFAGTAACDTFIARYVDRNLDVEDSTLDLPTCDSILGIIAEINRLSPTDPSLQPVKEVVHDFYRRLADSALAVGWRGYPAAHNYLLKTIAASPSHPEDRKELEAIRPWSTYLSDHPDLLGRYPDHIPVHVWLEIYGDFLRGSPWKFLPFHDLFRNRLVTPEQIEREFPSLSALDRWHLVELGFFSCDIEQCYHDGKPRATFGDSALIMADCDLTPLDDTLYLFQAVFIPRHMPDHIYALNLALYAASPEGLPEEFRGSGYQPYSFGTTPSINTIPNDKPSFVWWILNLHFAPDSFLLTVYAPGGPPWYPLQVDHEGDNIVKVDSPDLPQ